MSGENKNPVQRWQDYDCPESGIDFDLFDGAMVVDGQSFYCSGCGHEHVASTALVTEYECLDKDLRCVSLGTFKATKT